MNEITVDRSPRLVRTMAPKPFSQPRPASSRLPALGIIRMFWPERDACFEGIQQGSLQSAWKQRCRESERRVELVQPVNQRQYWQEGEVDVPFAIIRHK